MDLFCCAGGAGMGYHQAGFDVVGVDIKPQPRYPFEFIQADCLTLDRDFIATFDAVHASPPCQAYTDLRHRTGKQYAELIEPTRAQLNASGLPYVIENVERAPLHRSLRLCGTHFGLSANCWDGKHRYLKRYRLFEMNFPISGPGACTCRWQSIAGVYGNGGGGSMARGYKFGLRDGSEAMGIDWMRQAELSQAIPPAYTRWIGERLIAHLAQQRKAA